MTEVAARSLYEEDFYAWTQAQAAGLRRLAESRPNLPLDLMLIAEEIEDLGKSERDAVFSLAEQVMQHFLLIEHAPARRPRRRWMVEILGFRNQIERKITPSIRRQLEGELDREYARARRFVAKKMEFHGEVRAAERLPETCPYSLEQVLDDWMPEIGEPRR